MRNKQLKFPRSFFKEPILIRVKSLSSPSFRRPSCTLLSCVCDEETSLGHKIQYTARKSSAGLQYCHQSPVGLLSVPRWSKFRPKSTNGAGEKESWPEEFVAEFWPNFTKSGRKGAGKYFLKKFLIKWY